MPDPRRLAVLIDLRHAAHVSLEQMAIACGLTGQHARESVSAWEQGRAVPHASRRTHMLDYLADTLGLRSDLVRLRRVWDILVDEWKWDPLTDAELRHFRAPASTSAAPQEKINVPDHAHAQTLPPMALLPPGSRMPFSRNPHFVGRADEVRALAHALRRDGSTVAITVATGIGGIGKTQLAIEFVYRYGHEFTGGIFWLNCSDPAAVPAEIAACGGPGHLTLEPYFPSLPLDEQVRLVRAAWEAATPRLLIFDNCEDPELLRRWRPEHGGCRVLLTARRSAWDADLGVALLPLGSLPRHESLALLGMHRPPRPADAPDLAAIAAELGDLPLALHLAGRYLALGGAILAPSAYAAELRHARASVLRHPSLHTADGPSGYAADSVAGTFALSYARLDRANPVDQCALLLLAAAAALAPGEPIPPELLTAVALESGVAQEDEVHALQRLLDVGLLEPSATLERTVYRLHRLIAAFAREQPGALDGRLVVERVLLEWMRRENATDNHPALLPIQPHLRFVTDAALERGDLQAAALASEFSWHMHQVGPTAEAFRYNHRSLEIRTGLLGEDHPDLVQNLHTLGWTYDAEWQYERALAYHQRGLEIMRATYGADTVEVALSLDYVGMALHSAARYAEARRCYEAALTIHRRYSRPDHPEISELLNNIGLALINLGHYPEALLYLEQALALREQANPPNESLLSVTVNNIGHLLRSQGRFSEAQPYLERALEIRKHIFGPQGAYVAITLSHTARIAHYQARLDEAWDILQRVLRIFELFHYPEHPDIARTFDNLGMVRYSQRRFAEAEPYLERALTSHLQICGESHRLTARSLNHLGMLRAAQRRTSEAREMLERAIRVREMLLGDEHPDTANSFGHLGMLLLEQRDISGATPLLERALAAHQARLGEGHHYTARSLMRVGLLRRIGGDEEEASALLTRALAIYTDSLGANHPFTRRCRTYLTRRAR